jgi:hypothetical protein
VRIWTDHATGTRAERPEFAKRWSTCAPVTPSSYGGFDRLVRSLSDLVKIAAERGEHAHEIDAVGCEVWQDAERAAALVPADQFAPVRLGGP